MFIVRDKATGTTIEELLTIKEAFNLLAKYEAEDKVNDCYAPDTYEIVNSENGEWIDLYEYEHTGNIVYPMNTLTFQADILGKYNLSQSQASRLLDIPLRTVQDWARCKRTPPQWTLRLIDFYLSNHPN